MNIKVAAFTVSEKSINTCQPTKVATIAVNVFVCVYQLRQNFSRDNSKTCLKGPLKNRQNKDLNDKW